MKKFFNFMLLFVLAFCIIFPFRSTLTAEATPDRADSGLITQQTRQFILYEFGDAVSPEDLGYQLIDFAIANFTYDDAYMGKPQTADVNRFIFRNDFHGVCLDFALFNKAVFTVISQEKNWENVHCYMVISADRFKKRAGHALNYFTLEQPDGTVRIYELDTTDDHSHFYKHQPIVGLGHRVDVPDQEQVIPTIRLFFRSHYKYNNCFLS